MHRRILGAVVVAILIGLPLPAAASATGWLVKNAAGSRMGKVVRTAKRTAIVYDRTGKRCGQVTWSRTEDQFVAAKAYPSDTGLRKYAYLNGPGIDDAYDWYIDNQSYDGQDGLCGKHNRKWVVLTWSSNRARAKVAGRCPGWAAAGAGFVLSRAFK